jgi:hypothetical protein
MKWFITKLVFSVTTGNGSHTPQFDEQTRLIEARSYNEAFLKARFIGGREELAFMTEDLNAVKWQFIDVCELKELDNFYDGMELDSRAHEEENADTYINFIHHRASVIEQKTLSQSVVM